MREYPSLSKLGYKVELNSRRYDEAAQWCTKQFGPRWEVIDNRSGVWTMFWAGRGLPPRYTFQFANEKDMVLFILKWI